MVSGSHPEDTSLEGLGVPMANEAVRSFQIAVTLKLQRGPCHLGTCFARVWVKSAPGDSETVLRNAAVGSLSLGVKAPVNVWQGRWPRSTCGRSSLHLAAY